MIKIYNTLTRKVEDFVPLKKNKVTIYACGVTTYDEIHIGHARQAVFFDVVRNYFEYSGFDVVYVRNYTDIDDKIINRASKENKKSNEISEYYIQESIGDLKRLKVNRANYEPKVTECIEDIIKYIGELVSLGNAYVSNGEVLFDVGSFSKYGKLSNINPAEMLNGETSVNKKKANDFSLWKPAKTGEPFWNSPWGNGRPGWHIECSVMAQKYLGETIDIHGGGIDLLFPHHENEIAQSEAHNKKTFVNYWMHNGLVVVDGIKMSKSLGNFVTVKDALKNNYAEEIRYAILAQNYSSEIDFNQELFLSARRRMYYFYKTLGKIEGLINNADISESPKPEIPAAIKNIEKNFIESMNDNFNTVKVFANLSEAFSAVNEISASQSITPEAKKAIFIFFKNKLLIISKIFRIFEENPLEYINKLEADQLEKNGIDREYVLARIEDRQSFKVNKNYVEADKIRYELLNKRVNLKDSGDNTEWEVII